jgi:hypothetical protein
MVKIRIKIKITGRTGRLALPGKGGRALAGSGTGRWEPVKREA